MSSRLLSHPPVLRARLVATMGLLAVALLMSTASPVAAKQVLTVTVTITNVGSGICDYQVLGTWSKLPANAARAELVGHDVASNTEVIGATMDNPGREGQLLVAYGNVTRIAASWAELRMYDMQERLVYSAVSETIPNTFC